MERHFDCGHCVYKKKEVAKFISKTKTLTKKHGTNCHIYAYHNIAYFRVIFAQEFSRIFYAFYSQLVKSI